MEKSTVRVRPLRFAFLVEPNDKASLKSVFEINSALWGGGYNFIIPTFKGVPSRYRIPFLRGISALDMQKGLVEAFQPDFVVETKSGGAAQLGFSSRRVIPFQDLFASDDRGRRKIGIDLRSICDHLYDTTFKFVQRHPPEVLIPSSSTRRFDLFFAATFGTLPDNPDFKEIADVYLGALDGKREAIDPISFTRLFDQKYVYPLRLTVSETETQRQSYSIDSKLFYMDETSPYDLIDFWNLRALGWPIRPLPSSLAPQLVDYCEKFVAAVYRPFPPPSNAFHHASFLCSRTQKMDEMEAFVSKLKRPHPQAIILDPRVPRLWEDWGRGADHAKPQLVTSEEETVDTFVLGDGLHVSGAMPKFLKDDHLASLTTACVNVIEKVPNGAPVIPWRSEAMASLLPDFGEEKTWASREGIVLTTGYFVSSHFLRMPSAFNVFSAYFKHSGFDLTLSPAGRTCEQIIAALGDIQSLGIVARSREILRFLDQMAHGDVEVEVDVDAKTGKKKRVTKPYAPYGKLLEAVKRTNGNRDSVNTGHINALLRQNVLRLGMALRCTECQHTSWFSLEDVSSTLKCPRCMTEFNFPAGAPPRDSWAYKVSGPFAAENFAHGAYCVAAAIRFLSKDSHRKVTWLPSFEMKDAQGKQLEADFGVFAVPGNMDPETAPYLILGECKSFNRLEAKDFTRARSLANAFPGAALCFATFNESFTPQEIRALKSIVIRGRKRFDVGRIRTPIILLTARELFGQFKLGGFHDEYGAKANHARMVFMRGDLQELADFTQQTYLGMESYHQWLQDKHKQRALKRTANKSVTSNP